MKLKYSKIYYAFALILALHASDAHSSAQRGEEDRVAVKVNHTSYMPDEILYHIFSFLDPLAGGQSHRVCKRWNTILNREGVYPLLQTFSDNKLSQALFEWPLEKLESVTLPAFSYVAARLKMYLKTHTVAEEEKTPFETLVQQDPDLIRKANALRLIEGPTSEQLQSLLKQRRQQLSKVTRPDNITLEGYGLGKGALYLSICNFSQAIL